MISFRIENTITQNPSSCVTLARRLFAAGILLASAIFGTGLSTQADHGFKDGVYHISLDSLRKELSYPASSKIPSPLLSDFFGLQRIKDLSKPEILNDFVPDLASVSSENPVLRLRFQKGYTAAFYLDCTIAIDGFQGWLPQSFVEFGDFQPMFKDRYEVVNEFLGLLNERGLNTKYLVPNPYASEELAAADDLKSESRPRPTGWPQLTEEERAKEKAAAISGFEKSRRAILMFGDTHGSEEKYAAVWDYLITRPSPPGFDWIGLEMLTKDQQAILDTYSTEAEGSADFKKAEAKLREYFQSGWDRRFANPGVPEEGHYFRIVRWARQHKIHMFALDVSGEYTFFRYGEFPLGATTRNIVWAETVPLAGKGLIYGGSAHFVPLPATPFTFQDYVKRRDPGIELYLVR